MASAGEPLLGEFRTVIAKSSFYFIGCGVHCLRRNTAVIPSLSFLSTDHYREILVIVTAGKMLLRALAKETKARKDDPAIINEY